MVGWPTSPRPPTSYSHSKSDERADPGADRRAVRRVGANQWTPTDYARGPWTHVRAMAAPSTALLTRAVELADPESPVDWQIARLTIELTRPVPVSRPLTLTTDIERPGRKVSLVSARLDDEGTEVTRVRALRIRRRPGASRRHRPTAARPTRLASRRATPRRRVGRRRPHRVSTRDSCEHRVHRRLLGPARCGRRVDPTAGGRRRRGDPHGRTARRSGRGLRKRRERRLALRPLHVHRPRSHRPSPPAAGRRVDPIRAASYYGTTTASTGAGFAESAIYDRDGRLGRSVQSLILDSAPDRPAADDRVSPFRPEFVKREPDGCS